MRVTAALGRFGEDVAAAYLVEGGLVIVERNWRCREGELDIVARDGDVLVFCEVKTRSGDRFGTAAAAVDPRKAARIRRLAARWLREHDHAWLPVRFDVVTVRRDRVGPPRVEHLRAAF